MNRTRICRIIGGAAAGTAGLLGVYLKLVRPQTMRWGVTDEEAARPLPDDRVLHRPMPEEVAVHTAHQMPPLLTRS